MEVTGNINCNGKVQGGSLEMTGNVNCHGKVQGGSLEVTNVKATHVNAGSIDANTIVAHSKNFRIDHPTDPMRKYLIHATIESSEIMNLYSGVVVLDGKGEAEVALPEWFEALIDVCINNRHHGHKKKGNSEPVMKERMRAGRWHTFLVIRQSVAISSSRFSGWPLASVALKCAQTSSSGLSSGA